MLHLAQRRCAMTAEIVFGCLKLPGGMPKFVQGVMNVRMVLVFFVFLLQIPARRRALDVVAGILQRDVELFDRCVDRRQCLYPMAAEIVCGFLQFLAGIAQFPKA